MSFRSKQTHLEDLARAGLGFYLESLNLMHHNRLKSAVSSRCHTQATSATVKTMTTTSPSRADLLACPAQLGFEHLPDWRSHGPSGPPIWHLTIVRMDTFYVIPNQNFPSCNLCCCLLPCHCESPRIAWLCLLHTLLLRVIAIGRPLCLLKTPIFLSLAPVH